MGSTNQTTCDIDTSTITRVWRAEKTAGDWAVEGTQITGDDLKDCLNRMQSNGCHEANDVPRVFILSQGASGAVRVGDGDEVYLYWT